ncbi:MAG: tetratricopeptide repeat protein [Methanobacteriaceae archaeon]|jgi:tetratricopeptide (TPR) repeat protein|nr:tetratricopeptide repeat protein [Candidatus Methanorudis spinitermitis]
MVDLITINRKYEKIFKLLDMVLFFIFFSRIILDILLATLIIITNFYLPDFYWDLTSNVISVFGVVYVLILIFSVFFFKKGKTKQVKDFALTTLDKGIAFTGIVIAVNLVILLIFNILDWYTIVLLCVLLFFIKLAYDFYVFEGMLNLKLHKARKLRLKGNYNAALILFNELENENHEYPSLYYNSGIIYTDKEEYDKALEYFNKLITLEDNLKFKCDKDLCTSAYEYKAHIFQKLKRYDEALDAIDKAIVLKNNNDWSLNEKGDILSLLEKYDESLYFFDKAIELNSTNQHAYYSKAHALINLERYDEAYKVADSLLNINSNDTLALNIKTIVISKVKNYHKALDYIEEALKIDSTDHNTWHIKCYILYILNRYEKSLFCFKQSLKVGGDESLLKCIGFCFEKLGKLNEAKKYYHMALSYYDSILNENEEDSYNLLEKAIILEKLGKFDESLDICDKLLKEDSNDAETLFTKAYSLGKSGRVDESIKIFNRILKLKHDDAKILDNMGWILCENRKFEESLPYFNKALKLDPNNFNTLYNKGNALEKLNKYQKALEYYDKVLTINSGDECGLKGRERVLNKIKNDMVF